MTTVRDLIPGDAVIDRLGMFDGDPVFVARVEPHPLYPTLVMVIWRMPDRSWSHDALDARQEVGDTRPASAEQRTSRLRAALGQVSA